MTDFEGIARNVLEDAVFTFRRHQELGEKAIAQVPDDKLSFVADADGNSIAILVKHLAGNMRSRWTEFLTTDGEKPERHRDTEFEDDQPTREQLLERWREGWQILYAALEALEPADLARVVTIRRREHTVVEAINRQLTHYAYHVGQIVTLARGLAGEHWQTLSVARGQSASYVPEGRI